MRAREFIIEDQPDNPDSWESQAADAERDAETVRMADQDAEAGGLAETALKDKQDYDAKRQALQDLEREPGHDKEAVRQRKLDLEKEARAKGMAEGSKKDLPQWKKDWYAKQKPNSWPKHPQPYHNPDWIAQLSPEERKKLTGEKDDLNEKSTSQAQFRTMAAAAHNPKFAKKVGISPDVAREFHGADRKQNYKSLPRKAAEDASWGMAPEGKGYKK